MIIKCKMCGGDIEFTPGATYGTCEYCGSTSTIPKAEDEVTATTVRTIFVGSANLTRLLRPMRRFSSRTTRMLKPIGVRC